MKWESDDSHPTTSVQPQAGTKPTSIDRYSCGALPPINNAPISPVGLARDAGQHSPGDHVCDEENTGIELICA